MKEYQKPDQKQTDLKEELHTNSSKNYVVLSKGNGKDLRTLQATPDISTDK